MLIVLRMAVGLFEVPSFLINNRIATTWFGETRAGHLHRGLHLGRVRRAGFPHAGAGLAEGDVRLAVGVLLHRRARPGLVLRIFRRSYRDPAEFPGINASRNRADPVERRHPRPVEPDHHAARSAQRVRCWRDLGIVLGRRKLWGIYFGHFAWGTTSTFFLTWFPTYLVTYRHLDFIKAGFYASLPFLARVRAACCAPARCRTGCIVAASA